MTTATTQPQPSTARPRHEPVIEIRGLAKVFKDFWLRPRVTAVDDLDLTVERHEVYGLLGPNGSGKSTTIKILLGLLFADRGRVSVFGKLPTDVATKKRIGYLPEETYLYRFLNARETLDYYGRLFHLGRRERNRRIDMLLEMVGLEAVQRRPVGEYSKGMQRRIGLAQALINDPDLLILDEPTTGLDPIGTRQIKDLIVELKERGKTVLLSSHLLADVEDVCDRVSILYGGRKRDEGTVDQLLRVGNSTLIETDTLRPETITKIERLLEAEEGLAIRRVDAPRQRLETLFLEIVRAAQKEGLSTSGALADGRMAEFLAREAHLPEEVDGEALIDQLVTPDRDRPQPVEPPARGDSEEEPGAGEGKRVLQELIAPVDPADAPGGPRAAEPGPDGQPDAPEPEPEEADRGVIDELLGPEKKDK